jgi:hypothetical protein
MKILAIITQSLREGSINCIRKVQTHRDRKGETPEELLEEELIEVYAHNFP